MNDIKGKPRFNKKLVIICSVIGIVAIVLIINYIRASQEKHYNENIEMAAYYYEQKDYENAYEHIEDVSPKSEDEALVQKIKTLYYANSNIINDTIASIADSMPYEEAPAYQAKAYLQEISSIDFDREWHKELEIEKELVAIRQKYIGKLTSRFMVNQDRIEKILKMPEEAQEKEIAKMSKMSTSELLGKTVEFSELGMTIHQEQLKIESYGYVKNVTTSTLKNVQLQVDFFDSYDNLVDSVTANIFNDIKPNDQKFFLSITPKSEGEYAKFKVSLMSYEYE